MSIWSVHDRYSTVLTVVGDEFVTPCTRTHWDKEPSDSIASVLQGNACRVVILDRKFSRHDFARASANELPISSTHIDFVKLIAMGGTRHEVFVSDGIVKRGMVNVEGMSQQKRTAMIAWRDRRRVAFLKSAVTYRSSMNHEIRLNSNIALGRCRQSRGHETRIMSKVHTRYFFSKYRNSSLESNTMQRCDSIMKNSNTTGALSG